MIPVAEPWIGEEELQLVMEAVKSGWVSSSGRFVTEFEERFAAYCGARCGVATSNGTAALHLALAALGIGPGDEVIVPALTFVATANAVTFTGARPVIVDVCMDNWGLDAEQLEAAITPRTRAIIPVHLYGHPCNMDAIMPVARASGLFVVEDAAEAHGAEIRGRKVGTLADVGCFSFYGNKIMTTGEGGMCLTNDPALAQRMRVLRGHGMSADRKYWHEVVGFNYRMTNLQAALGVAQLGKLDRLVEKKRQIAQWYAERLKDLEAPGILGLHPEAAWARCVYWMYSILVKGEPGEATRLMAELATRGIETRPFFVPMHLLPPYRLDTRLPVAETLYSQGINLPSGTRLEEDQVDWIASSVRQVLGR